MAEADRQRDAEVVEMVEYLRETLREVDDTIADLTARRESISLRLAVIQAATTPGVEAAIADFENRGETDDPYHGEDAAGLLSEAHRRFGS